jgi:glycosyltransferase involved in cell wall biosynthesis
MARFTDVLIGVSEATVDDLVGLGVAPREKFRVVPLGAELSQFTAGSGEERGGLRAELGVADDETLLLFVGRLVPIKRVDVLLQSLRHAVAQGAPVQLAIVGDGELRTELEELSAEMGLQGRVHFLGYRRDLPRIAAAADIAVLSSDNEGTPVALIEAAAAGLPAVATSVGGVPEVVGEDVGVVVPPRDPQAFGMAVATLAGDRELRRKMGTRAREAALQRYSHERLLNDVRDLYEELLAGAAAGASVPSG